MQMLIEERSGVSRHECEHSSTLPKKTLRKTRGGNCRVLVLWKNIEWAGPCFGKHRTTVSYAHASRRITRNPNRSDTELESTSPPDTDIRENKEEAHVSL